MAYFSHSILLNVGADKAWDALRDVGNLHTRLVRGFVVECEFDGSARLLTFANGVRTTERIVAISESNRRVSWSAISERIAHHNASAQVVPEGPGSCRFIWSVDVLPDSIAPSIEAMVQAGLQSIKLTLEQEGAV
ncbi:Polyketide cyclase / dehydrase and lipid transport [Acidovorax sp. CF316]|uniref:SRPBCC family protein n=1 Tax=Acidovorax sp. CF316 TaxID=1144317 RepID=UPI00026BDE8E|nr:SRPBCC family protein [Acidovorax sp. CF316]EJE53182.1 Polyketide cyclase / dehydrase and lipid transport [Acidovorax sp. CF316]